MRERGQWRLSDLQRLLLALAVVTVVFLSAMSLGMGSFGLLLVALLLLVVAGLGVFLLGLWYQGRRQVQGGTAYVIMASPAPVGSIVGRCDLRLLIDLPDGGTKMVKLRDPAVSVTRWPRPGAVLPIEVDQRNPRLLRVRWDRVNPNQQHTTTADDLVAPFHTEFADDLDATPTGNPYVGPTGDDPYAGPTAPAQTPMIIEDYIPDELATMLVDDDVAEYRVPGDESPSPFVPTQAAEEPTVEAGLGAPVVEHFDEPDPDDRTMATEFGLPVRGIPQPRPSEPVIVERPADSVAEIGPARPGMGIMLVVSDLNRSVAFYHDTLGFELADSAPGGAVLAYGGGRLVLRPQADMSPVDRRVIHLHIEVPDVEVAYQELRAKGVDFVHKPRVLSRGDKLELWAARFRDPDGHGIALTQWRDRQEAPRQN